MRQPTPQKGQTEFDLAVHLLRADVRLWAERARGQACTHSPQATQVCSAMGRRGR